MQEGFQRSVLPLYIKQTAIKRLPLPTKQSSNTVYVQNPNQPIPLWTYFQESLVFYILLYKQGEGGGGMAGKMLTFMESIESSYWRLLSAVVLL